MTGMHVSVQLRAVSSNAVKEVLVMGLQIGTPGAFRDEFVAWPVESPAHGMAHEQDAVRAIKRGAVFVSFLSVGRPVTLFKNQLPLAALRFSVVWVLEDGILSIGKSQRAKPRLLI